MEIRKILDLEKFLEVSGFHRILMKGRGSMNVENRPHWKLIETMYVGLGVYVA